MKKPVKITLISIGSLIGLVLLAAAVLVWVVLTPKRLTPIVNKAAASFVTCPTKIGSVELTFFSTFPKVSLRVDDVLLLNSYYRHHGLQIFFLCHCYVLLLLDDYFLTVHDVESLGGLFHAATRQVEDTLNVN